jgi:hypothetical protein
MSNRDILTNKKWITWISVKYRGILNVAAFSNLNQIVVAADNDFGPNVCALMKLNPPNYFSALGNPSALC